MTMGNKSLWDAVQATDPKYTKQFNRGGGFKGTATNATYLARKATEQFGPCGTGWGISVVDEQIITGAPHLADDGSVLAYDLIHKVRARLWYVLNGVRGEVEQFGQTQIVGRNKNGFYTDEEAPKKSLTDAMSKCLSLLGFSADIHLGLYDDNKYVAEVTEQFAPRITADQVLELKERLAETDSVIAKFCEAFAIDSLEAMPAAKFATAKAKIAEKAARMAKLEQAE